MSVVSSVPSLEGTNSKNAEIYTGEFKAKTDSKTETSTVESVPTSGNGEYNLKSKSNESTTEKENVQVDDEEAEAHIKDNLPKPISYIEMLDAPRKLEEPVDITFDYLKEISEELGLIKLCWPVLLDVTFEDRSNFPESYLKNSNKEKLLLLYAENFRRQFCYQHPDRKPLFLACDNECGMQKMVCTTIRSTTLPYSELETWEKCSRFVADHLRFEPLEQPTLISRRWVLCNKNRSPAGRRFLSTVYEQPATFAETSNISVDVVQNYERTMSATKAGKRPLRTLTAHEKLNAIKRVSVGGESKASVARDIGVPESTLRGWCKNQEKISYQVRTSPTNIDDSSENINLPPAKRIKLDEQPYNLCMKTNEASNGSYSPNSENHFDGEYPKSSETESENSPLNLRTKPDTTSAPISATPKSTTNQSAIDKEKEREKNRAELARLSAELGLNRPEVFLSTLNTTNNMTDVTSLLIQWNSIYQQHLMYQQQKALQQQNKNKVTAPADTSTKIPASNGLLTTVDKRDKVLPNTEQQPSVYDSVSYWLRQQSLMGINNTNSQQSMLNLSSCLPSTSSMTHVTTTTTSATNNSALLNGMTPNQSVNQQLRFWNWYKQSAYNATQMQQAAAAQQPHLSPQQPDKQILYQQLTKEVNEKEINSENEVAKEDKPKNGNKNRSVLDNLLLNNNTIDYECHKETEPLEAHEAIEHGEKFLHWLESCSDPSVTTMQILTLQTLIKNLKTGFDRKNGDCQSKTKVKRK